MYYFRVSLRDRKQTYVNLVRAYQRQGKLSEEEARGFDAMFRRCRTQEEQSQVFDAMMGNVNRLATGTDRYAVLHRDDLFEEA